MVQEKGDLKRCVVLKLQVTQNRKAVLITQNTSSCMPKELHSLISLRWAEIQRCNSPACCTHPAGQPAGDRGRGRHRESRNGEQQCPATSSAPGRGPPATVARSGAGWRPDRRPECTPAFNWLVTRCRWKMSQKAEREKYLSVSMANTIYRLPGRSMHPVPSSSPSRSLGWKGAAVPVPEHHWQVSVLSTTGADADLGLGRSSPPLIQPVGPKVFCPRWFVSVVQNARVSTGCTNCSLFTPHLEQFLLGPFTKAICS